MLDKILSKRCCNTLALDVYLYSISLNATYTMQPQGTPENGYLWHRVSPQLSSPNQPYSLREALAQAQSSRIGTTTRALRESLHPILRQKLVCFTCFFFLINMSPNRPPQNYQFTFVSLKKI